MFLEKNRWKCYPSGKESCLVLAWVKHLEGFCNGKKANLKMLPPPDQRVFYHVNETKTQYVLTKPIGLDYTSEIARKAGRWCGYDDYELFSCLCFC